MSASSLKVLQNVELYFHFFFFFNCRPEVVSLLLSRYGSSCVLLFLSFFVSVPLSVCCLSLSPSSLILGEASCPLWNSLEERPVRRTKASCQEQAWFACQVSAPTEKCTLQFQSSCEMNTALVDTNYNLTRMSEPEPLTRVTPEFLTHRYHERECLLLFVSHDTSGWLLYKSA